MTSAGIKEEAKQRCIPRLIVIVKVPSEVGNYNPTALIIHSVGLFSPSLFLMLGKERKKIGSWYDKGFQFL